MASLQNPAQTSKPRTPKPQNLIFGPGTEERSPRFAQILSVPYQTLLALKRGAPDLHRFCPFHIKLCSTKPKTVASLQNPALKPQNHEPQNPKTLFLDLALKRGAPDLHRFCPFHIKLCSTKPKTVAGLQNPAQTSKPRTPKPQNLIFGPDTEERSPRFAQILSVPYQTLLNEAQNRGQPSKTQLKPQNLEHQNLI